MSAGIHKIDAEKGATFSRSFTWKIDSNVVNLTGYSARMKVRDPKRAPSVNQIISLTSATGGGITLGGSAGTITLTIAATIMDNIVAGKYVYDLELEAPDGVVTRLLKGQFNIFDEVTY